MQKQGNGWKRRPLGQAFVDGFQGIGEASRERIMRIIYACIAISAVIGVVRGLKELGWIFLVAYSGMLISREHDNNVHERQEQWRNRFMAEIKSQQEEWNEDTRYILHQATASVLTLGVFGLIAAILVLVFNPGWRTPW